MQVWKYSPLLLCKHLIFRHVLPEVMTCNLLKLLTRTVLQGLPELSIDSHVLSICYKKYIILNFRGLELLKNYEF